MRSSNNERLKEVELLVRRALVAMPAYRDDIVLVGGLVPHLYRRVPGVRVPEHAAIATTEADLSIKRPLPVVDKAIPALLYDADFVVYEVPSLDPRRPGAQRFQDVSHGTVRSAPTYLEFLTPLAGKPVKGLVEPHPGLRVPALRYLDLLAHETLVLDLAAGEAAACPVRLPHPVPYALQKVLARSAGRAPAKRAKDMAYVYDVALLFEPLSSTFADVFTRAGAASSEWKTWLARAHRELGALFQDGNAAGALEAHAVYQDVLGDKAPSAEAIARVVLRFHEALAPR